MKQQFITSLKNGQVPFLENEKLFSTLSNDLFEPFDSMLVSLESHQHRWSEDYFNQKVMDLDFNFSKELVLHLIEVKKYLQYKDILKTDTQPVENINKTILKSDKNPTVNLTTESQIEKKEEKEENVTKPDLLNFKPNEKLAKFLSDNDIGKIRTYLMSIVNNRRMDLEEIFKSIWYVYQHKPSIFEESENSAFIQDIDKNESNWNIEYFNQQQVYLNKNFTLARLLHLANVRETLMKKGDSNFQQLITEKTQKVEPAKIEQSQIENPQVEQKEAHSTDYSSNSQPTAEQRGKTEQNTIHRNNQNESDNSFIKTVVMIGGAVLALGLALFAIFK